MYCTQSKRLTTELAGQIEPQTWIIIQKLQRSYSQFGELPTCQTHILYTGVAFGPSTTLSPNPTAADCPPSWSNRACSSCCFLCATFCMVILQRRIRIKPQQVNKNAPHCLHQRRDEADDDADRHLGRLADAPALNVVWYAVTAIGIGKQRTNYSHAKRFFLTAPPSHLVTPMGRTDSATVPVRQQPRQLEAQARVRCVLVGRHTGQHFRKMVSANAVTYRFCSACSALLSRPGPWLPFPPPDFPCFSLFCLSSL